MGADLVTPEGQIDPSEGLLCSSVACNADVQNATPRWGHDCSPSAPQVTLARPPRSGNLSSACQQVYSCHGRAHRRQM